MCDLVHQGHMTLNMTFLISGSSEARLRVMNFFCFFLLILSQGSQINILKPFQNKC